MSNLEVLKQHRIGEGETTIYVGITPAKMYSRQLLQVKFFTRYESGGNRGIASASYNLRTTLPYGYEFRGRTAPMDSKHMDLFMQILQKIAPGKYPNIVFVEGYWEEFTPPVPIKEEWGKAGILLLDGDLHYGHIRTSKENVFQQDKSLVTIYKDDLLYIGTDTLVADLTKVQKKMLRILQEESEQ